MRGFVFSMVLLLLSASVAFASVASTCVTCHKALDRQNSEPVRLWERDLHREAGIGCHDCHGGDPGDFGSAMAHSEDFRGALEGSEAVKLCGGCHSRANRIHDPTVAIDQLEQYLSGRHGDLQAENSPTCVTCHGSHGIYRVTDPSSPVFPTRVTGLCIQCHDKGSPNNGEAEPWRYLQDVHGRALDLGTNRNAPSCPDCHGAHRAAALTASGIQMVCGNCHTKEYEYFQTGPHGDSLRLVGEPTCTHCHGYHGIKATGIDEIAGKISDNCWGCHEVGSRAWEVGSNIDENLGVAMSLLGSLQDMAAQFRLDGIETREMEKLNREAFNWLLRVESAIHSVDTDWEELTGMAKVKMMAAWDLARDYNLEKGIRRVILLFIAFLAVSILGLLAYKLNLAERDQMRRHQLGSPEARQREQERHRK